MKTLDFIYCPPGHPARSHDSANSAGSVNSIGAVGSASSPGSVISSKMAGLALHLPGIATSWIALGNADFVANSFIFKSDCGYANFTGTLAPSNARVDGTISLKDLRRPHQIDFTPWKEE